MAISLNAPYGAWCFLTDYNLYTNNRASFSS